MFVFKWGLGRARHSVGGSGHRPGMGGHCTTEAVGMQGQRWGLLGFCLLITYSPCKWSGISRASRSGIQTQLRRAQEGWLRPGHPHTSRSAHMEASSLSALAKAWIPSHICTARMKACNFHRIQFFELELHTNVCFIFLFKVITHDLVVGKA